MTQRFLFYLILAASLQLSSCDSFFPCIDGNNRIATETRNIGEFQAVHSYGDYIVDIYYSDSPSLKIETDENLLEHINTYIQGSNLILETKRDRCIRSREPIRIEVGVPFINSIKLGGSGTIYCDYIDAADVRIEILGSGKIECLDVLADLLEVNLLGSGDIELQGMAGVAEYHLTGSGNIKTLALEVNKCYADISGSGNIYTWAKSLLDVKISGSGNLYYKGNPQIISHISGSGNINVFK